MKIDISPEEAREILNCSLTEEDLDQLMGIKHEINHNIRWGKVLDEAFGPIFQSVEKLILEGREGLSKDGPPVDSLFTQQRDFLLSGEKSQLHKHYVTLLLMKKLLGGLKTKVNQALSEFRVLSYVEEGRITDIADNLDSEGEWDFIERRLDELGIPDEEPEERRFPRPQITARLGWEESSICNHLRTKIRRKKADGSGRSCDEVETYCKDCRTVVETRLVGKNQRTRHELWGWKKKEGEKDSPCKHRRAEWVEGQEGQVARCCDKKGCTELITDPEQLRTFQWEKVGLEPYGDDPSQDEVIIL
jgi:hypothetical protein